MTHSSISRRQYVAGALATAALAPAAFAAAPLAKTQSAGVHRINLGSFQLTALYDGLWPVKIDDNFVRNASNAEVDAALASGVSRARHLAGHRSPRCWSTPARNWC